MSGEKRRKPRNDPSPTLYQKNQPIWKTAIIQILRGTIGVLETTVVKLETETPNDSQKKKNFLSSWDGFLRTFRLFLPSSISNNVSDTVLTGIFAVIFAVTIGITTFLFIPKSVEVATVPPTEEVTAQTPIIEPETTPTPAIEPEPTPVIETILTPTPVIEPEPTPTPIVEAKQMSSHTRRVWKNLKRKILNLLPRATEPPHHTQMNNFMLQMTAVNTDNISWKKLDTWYPTEEEWTLYT